MYTTKRRWKVKESITLGIESMKPVGYYKTFMPSKAAEGD